MARIVVTTAQFYALLEQGERVFSRVELRGLRRPERNPFGNDSYETRWEDIAFRDATFTDWSFDDGTIENCHFSGVSFARPLLTNVRFIGCRFSDSVWKNSTFRNVDFRSCFIVGGRYLYGRADTVTFVDCKVADSKWSFVWWDGLRFTDCHLTDLRTEQCAFTDSDITEVIDTAGVNASPSLDWKTVCRSLRAVGMSDFLLTHGMPEVMATYLLASAQSLDKYLLFRLMRSTFISYGSPDVQFARRLRDSLHRSGVRTYFFEDDARPGERLHTLMWRAVNDYDRVIIVCSSNSLNRKGVSNEIQQTLDREARDGGASYLIPVTIDDDVFIRSDMIGVILRDRVVADFRHADSDSTAFKRSVARLLTALKAE